MKIGPSLSIPPFDRHFFDSDASSSRIGDGALGGKASGLVRLHSEILASYSADEFPDIDVTVPKQVVLTTELFDAFMKRNDLFPIALSGEPDDRIAHAFQRGAMPAEFIGDLRALAQQVHQPLAVRSSSLLEDDLAHPFAGVYATKMIPNNQTSTDMRFAKLVEAIKFVWASTFFEAARTYLAEVGGSERDEKMAVIIQEVVGERYRDRFYPTMSGVGRSYNYYPTGHARPEDGVVNLALGLGKTIVDGGLNWTYSPAYPKSPPPFAGPREILKNTQTKFWAVHMGQPPLPDPIRETEYLNQHELSEAVSDNTLRHLVSSYDQQSDQLYPGQAGQGPYVLDFSPLLSLGVAPINAVVQRVVQLATEHLGLPVEIEFAATLDAKKATPARFGLLQVRPMMVSDEEVELSPEALEGANVLLASSKAMGNGVRDDLRDIIYVKPQSFRAAETRKIAAEIGQLNRSLMEDGSRYVLIGFGRWGSSDPWLGIPVQWGQITGARVIVETTIPQMNPDLSQGSHFFHNLISFRVLYFSVQDQQQTPIDWAWLEAQETRGETTYVKHIRTAHPLLIRADGRNRRGVVEHND